MSNLQVSPRKPIVSAKFLTVVFSLFALVFVGSFATVYLKEVSDSAAAAKNATPLNSAGVRPSMPGVSGTRPESTQEIKERQEEKAAKESR